MVTPAPDQVAQAIEALLESSPAAVVCGSDVLAEIDGRRGAPGELVAPELVLGAGATP